MSVTPRLIETKVHSEETREERRRYQFRDEEEATVLSVDTIDGRKYASNWDVSFEGAEDFQHLLEKHYADPCPVETQAVYRSEEDEMGGKLLSTYERVTQYERHPHDCVYMEFRYGPHTIAWSEESEGGELSLSVEGNDLEPLRRFLDATLQLSDDEIERIGSEIHEDLGG